MPERPSSRDEVQRGHNCCPTRANWTIHDFASTIQPVSYFSFPVLFVNMEPNLAVLPLSHALWLICILPTTSTLQSLTLLAVCNEKSSSCRVVQTDMKILLWLCSTITVEQQTRQRFHLCTTTWNTDAVAARFWRLITEDGNSQTAAWWKEMEKFPAGK